MYVYICVCLCMYVFVYLYTYTHIYTHGFGIILHKYISKTVCRATEQLSPCAVTTEPEL